MSDERLAAGVPGGVRWVNAAGIETAHGVGGQYMPVWMFEGEMRPSWDCGGQRNEGAHVKVTPSVPFLGAVASSASPAGEPGTRLNLALLNLRASTLTSGLRQTADARGCGNAQICNTDVASGFSAVLIVHR